MPDNTDNQTVDCVDLTRDIVAAYIANNFLSVSKLPALIQEVHTALARLADGAADPLPEETQEKPTPA